ncbi:hypothetical protein GOBAR_DD13315 [Gossypium barbadense]|nr:hypothetical protein GOBAR_DD13315 [Gossypium barbadense]
MAICLRMRISNLRQSNLLSSARVTNPFVTNHDNGAGQMVWPTAGLGPHYDHNGAPSLLQALGQQWGLNVFGSFDASMSLPSVHGFGSCGQV